MLKNTTDFFTGMISIYMLFILLRIVMSWFTSPHSENGVLAKLCDPYLNLFRKTGFFTIGYIDFSPIVALAVLVIAANILNHLGLAGTITFSIVLAIFIRSIWSAIYSLMFFIFIIAVIRLIIALIKPNAQSAILTTLDSLLAPVSAKISSIFVRNSNFTTNLTLFAVVLIITYFVGNLLINFLYNNILKIPF